MASLKRFATLGGAAAAPATTDPQFNLTTLLLHGDGTNGAQNNTFLDSSTNNFTITRNGNTTQGTYTPFSQTGWSNFFNGADHFYTASSSALVLSGTTWTLEAWEYCIGGTGYRTVLSKRSGSVAEYEMGIDPSGFFYVYIGSTVYVDTTVVPLNSWVNLTVSYNSTNMYMFQNGILTKTSAMGGAGSGTGVLAIGVEAGSAGQRFPGYISNIRITKNAALYTNNFSPSTLPLTTTVSSGTVSLLTCQSNRFVDNSSNAYAFTIVSAPSVRAFSPFAPTFAYSPSVIGGSGYFDGTGDYLSIADNAALQFGTGTFTIQGWVYRSVAGVLHTIAAKGEATPTGWVFQINASNQLVFTDTSTSITTTTTIPANTWTHVAVVRSGTGTNQTVLYINAVSSATGTSATNFNQTSSLNIAADRSNANTFNGYISGLEFVKGSALSISIPTAPPTTSNSPSALLNFTNAGIIDNTSRNVLETVGNAQISTSVKKFGTGSLAFDGTGDYLTFPNSPITQLGTGDFTIEGWVYLNTVGASSKNIISKGGSTTGWAIAVDDSAVLKFTYGSGIELNGATALVINTWYYFTFVRSGTATGNVKIYLNGVLDATSSTAITTNFNQTNIGYIGANRTGTALLSGYIDDLRVTKYARYTANFTPPTAAFLDQ